MTKRIILICIVIGMLIGAFCFFFVYPHTFEIVRYEIYNQKACYVVMEKHGILNQQYFETVFFTPDAADEAIYVYLHPPKPKNLEIKRTVVKTIKP